MSNMARLADLNNKNEKSTRYAVAGLAIAGLAVTSAFAPLVVAGLALSAYQLGKKAIIKYQKRGIEAERCTNLENIIEYNNTRLEILDAARKPSHKKNIAITSIGAAIATIGAIAASPVIAPAFVVTGLAVGIPNIGKIVLDRKRSNDIAKLSKTNRSVRATLQTQQTQAAPRR